MKSLLAALSVFAVCSAGHLHAAERVALVIGNDAYRHARPLKTAVNDSSAVAATLKSLGFDTITASNAGLEQMVDALEKLRQQSVGARAVLVYYAGHGIEAQGGNYLVPVDAKLEREIQLKTQAVSLSDVLEELKLMAVPARMVILDCCRDNPLEGRSWLETRAYGGGLATLAEDSLQEATLVVYAASPGKPALDRVSGADTQPFHPGAAGRIAPARRAFL
ncbi:MAG: caspase family protein [Verrucomicrobiaceae bacterium]|nr:caspase family protein [Verrucomicrobiaceae bacterium]